ncbi:acyl-CoA reductase-like NAD-dependent aldehyde dehydrogenase [Hymenobacter luteus]|uniref:Acyl-CoA reductase-like NAD-dependent aldehyde dehydrogenase n=2 Tax=Hymenobacter TaxID=89966 RepID=A0A7W9WC42_9BACT|nr:acyl-CoA reductase-like NAD-dependent aldehyde dehydrogenase [Hymenobacter latericoloratus]MBB6060474.1 acyl-CoA reductase-like NAD-dependent aldehyde dehydrogenase [Hymenobacter luteus]
MWVNCYPADAPFGGYRPSGYGRENHRMMLAHYRQNKNMLISYSQQKLSLF